MHSSGGVPDFCKFSLLEEAGGEFVWVPCAVPLLNANGIATWFEHPSQGRKVDIAVLPLKDRPSKNIRDILEPAGHDENMFVDLGTEVFLPGYPKGIAFAKNMAIWKRASIASSLEIGEGVNNFFYVDTATREGMSGAPCLVIANRDYYVLDRATGKVALKNNPLSWRLLGVYSGRINTDEDDQYVAQLGKVWRENFIFEIIEKKKAANIEVY